ncbi:MAG: hypothetical protein JXA21_14565 [Anaerolineae bacterium]|nr:hypothetical protein [Anaerolineae bacterium]
MTETDTQAIEDFIREVFAQNYEELRLESGQALAADARQTALNQVLLYWRKLRAVAESVTDTEVRLSLPGCETPHEREYTIEGVVDILQEAGRTVMYDIKTHDADYVRANLDLYEQQLNVYAHIWHALRGQALDEMAIIATDYPEAVQAALTSGDPEHLAYALERWQPVVPIAFDARRVETTIHEFGEVVDAIEENHFAPRPLADLQTPLPGVTHHARFGTRVCRQCDARFSCASYREYAWQPGQHGVAEERFRQYYEETPPDAEQEQWRAASLEAVPDAEDARADY